MGVPRATAKASVDCPVALTCSDGAVVAGVPGGGASVPCGRPGMARSLPAGVASGAVLTSRRSTLVATGERVRLPSNVGGAGFGGVLAARAGAADVVAMVCVTGIDNGKCASSGG